MLSKTVSVIVKTRALMVKMTAADYKIQNYNLEVGVFKSGNNDKMTPSLTQLYTTIINFSAHLPCIIVNM